MKQMNIMKIMAARERHRLLLSTIIVLALLLLTWSLIPVVFETNDDSFMMGYLAGAWTGGRYDIQPVPVGKDCVSTLCSQCGDSLV